MTFQEFISYKRPHGSKSEQAFITRYLMPLHAHGELQFDGIGNLFVTVGEGSTTLFTSHTDTCHRTEGMQKVRTDKRGVVSTAKDAKECLGADDGAGMWVMIKMIEAGVPGTYAFFRGEERGGIGSSWLAKHRPEFLKKFNRAIAFDRAGSTDVITHQGGVRCASNEFAEALSNALNDQGLLYMPCDGGVYTDTAEFTEIIPECTNISVGYDKQHTPMETQDLTYLNQLVEACCRIDWETLPTHRDPSVFEDMWCTGSSLFPSLKSSWKPTYVDDIGFDAEAEAVIYAWMDGDSEPLIEAMAQRIYPDDTTLARRHVDVSRMTDDLADEALIYGLDILADELMTLRAH